jgi:uncharacterized membrane protein
MKGKADSIDWNGVDMRMDIAEKTENAVAQRGFAMKTARGLPSRSMLLAVALPLCVPAMLLAGTGQASADFRVCNATQSLVGVGIGYRAKSGWITEGWWHVDASSCKTLIEGPLSSRYYYLYAEDAERGGRWDGPINMCVAEKEFKIAGVNDCFARGFQRAGFQEYDTGEQSSWMVQLTDTPAPNGQTAANGTGANGTAGNGAAQ